MRIVTLSQPTGGWTAGTDKKETVKSEKVKEEHSTAIEAEEWRSGKADAGEHCSKADTE